MEKKNFSEGLENISSVFLSTDKKNEDQYLDSGFSAVPKREETCESCVNLLKGSSGILKCRIFTFENKKHGITHLDTITANHAHYCNFFSPIIAEKNGSLKKVKNDLAYQVENEPEIEEAVTAFRKIVYPDTETSQNRMRKTVLRYMGSGYHIKFIELGKSTDITAPKKKKSREEKITISIQKSEKS